MPGNAAVAMYEFHNYFLKRCLIFLPIKQAWLTLLVLVAFTCILLVAWAGHVELVLLHSRHNLLVQ